MHLGFSFALLLGSLLLALTALGGVDALPAKRTSAITMPVKRLHGPRNDLHPLLSLQQRINRANRRLARMTGRAGPTDEQLHAALVRRVLAVEGESGLAARFNRHGVPNAHQLAARYNRHGVPTYMLPGSAPAKAQSFAVAANSSDSAASNSSDSTASKVPPVTSANAPKFGSSLGLDIEGDDVGYIATIQIGTPSRDFRMLVDSGSLQTWVGGENCTNSGSGGGGCGNHIFLGPSSSSTFNQSTSNFTEQLGSGSVSGALAADNLSIAGMSLFNYTLGVASQESIEFAASSVPLDGVMALGQSNLIQAQTSGPSNVSPVLPVAAAQQGTVRQAIVAMKIPRLADGKNDGEISFGDIDPGKFDAKSLVTFANTNPSGFWGAPLDAVTVNGTDLGIQNRSVIFDTGTTLMLAPPPDAEAIHQAIPGAQSDGQGGYTVPCNMTTEVALTFDGRSYSIDPRDVAFAPHPDDPTTCSSGIVAGSVDTQNDWLVGDTFLKNVYIAFNMDLNNIQMANLV